MSINAAHQSRFRHAGALRDEKPTYRLLSSKGVSLSRFKGRPVLVVDPGLLTQLSQEALRDASFLLRASHLKQLAFILQDPQASDNDRFVARELLRNASIAARFVLPMCQDTGTAIVYAKKGNQVWTGADDAKYIERGLRAVYQKDNLRYSQLVPLSMYEEKNTGDNMPAEINISSVAGTEYEFLLIAKGGGSANKTFLFQETKALLEPGKLRIFLAEKMKLLGTAACPPYHIGIAIGGTSAEACLKAAKMATAGYWESLMGRGSLVIRDPALEEELFEEACQIGYGAQFGGKYFAHDVRVLRLPRHGASLPIALAVSCSADRNIRAKINKNGVYLEELERNPSRYFEGVQTDSKENARSINLNRPMKEILSELSHYPIGTRLLLTGRMIVARDIAHARLKERLARGEALPEYFKNHPVYYAGPAKTPKGKPSGSFGPTTSGRMDSYLESFMSSGASLISLGKGNRSPLVTDACRKFGGFYLGSIGGAAAILAEQSIKKVAVEDFPELGMESVWAIDVENFPAFILIDDKGNDFFRQAKKSL